MDRFVCRIAGGAVCVLVSVAPARVFADDLFEIEVFHVRVNEPNQLGLELHSNYVVAGAARDPPEVSPNHVLYELLEPTFGLLKGWEIGAHIQVAFRSGHADWGGDRLRTMVVIPTPESLPFKFGVNLEGGYTPPLYNPNTWDIELRPIAEWQISDFDFDVNPVLDFPLTGPRAGVPRLQPSAAARYALLATVDLGLEYYADVGSISHLEPVAREGHYLFETVELVKWPTWKVRAGLGEGLTPGSNPLTLTTIVGHFF